MLFRSYWAITTLTTTGYGDIAPTTTGGRIFTMMVMLTGFSAFGLIVGQVSNLIMTRNKKLEENRQKMEDLTMFMNFYEIPKKLRGEVFGFYEHLINKKLSDNDTKIIAELPQSLQHELQTYIKIKLISPIPVFHGLPHECLKEVALRLKQQFFSAGDYIIKKGDTGNEMYIIDHGDAEVLGSQDLRIAQLGEGQCFGEIALLTEVKRTADVKALSYCDLFKFEKSDFEELCKKFEPLHSNFTKIMKRRTG